MQYGEAPADQPTPTKKKKRRKKRGGKQSSLPKDQLQEFNALKQQLVPDYQPHHLLTFGDQLYDLPAGIDDLTDMTVMRAGLHLGTFKKRRFEPALAWALALDPGDVARQIELTHDQWRQYVHGDTVQAGADLPNGWYLLVCDHHSCGFGKLVNGTIKNFYPKGLRF